jgi:hypothetical protein
MKTLALTSLAIPRRPRSGPFTALGAVGGFATAAWY